MQDSNIKTVSVPLIRGSAMHISDLEVIGSYSVNSEREYVDDLSELRYYKEPANKNVRFDLNYNANTTISTVDEPWDTNFLLKWISNNFDSLRAQDVNKNKTQRLAAHFICYRGVLKNLLHTPFNTSSGWIICAAKLKESIYLYHYDTDEVIKQNLNMTEHAKRLTAYGFKFQQFALSDTPFKDPNVSIPCNENRQFCCIFKSKLGDKELLYAAEIDGIHSEQTIKDTIVGKNYELLELKTISLTLFFDQNMNIRDLKDLNRLFSWWAQSYWVGIEKLIIGCRDNHGVVKKIRHVKLSEFDDLIKYKQKRSLGFCNKFLEFVNNTVTEEHDTCLYKFTFDPKKKNIAVEKLSSISEYAFLDDWYVKKIDDHFANE